MSGIEVAGLVFGVLPILIEAVKAYGTVADRFRTFKHYSREVKSISQRLDTQNGIFYNHCKLLLLLVEDKKAAEGMFEDPTDLRWTSKDLNDKLNAVLEDSVEHCKKIIEGTRDVLDEVREEMGSFDVLVASRKKDESIKKAIKRLKGAIKITFHKPSYEQCLVRLREQNNDLALLQSQISAFQKHFTSTKGSLLRRNTLPERFRSIHDASQKLHEALCSAWCCDDAEHRGHYVKLCLDAEVQTEVRLDLAISCHETFDGRNNNLVYEPPIWLYVQSLSLTAPQRTSMASQTIPGINVIPPANMLANTSPNPQKKKASSDLEPACSSRKKKRVQWANADNANLALTAISPISHITLPEFNLCQTKNMCHYIKRNYGQCASSVSKDCLGYLETPCQMYKHKFYLRNRGLNTGAVQIPEQNTVYSIFDTMRHTSNDALEIEDQLKLAHKAAIAILQYNDTPWLIERWRLSNMSYFGSRHIFDDTTLKTLHLSSQMSQPNAASATVMEGVQTTVSDELKYGVNNTPLFFLGVALLEIAHWQPLEDSMRPQDEGNQIFTARRLANGRSTLGPEYQQIIRKCLQCNFGYGTKLESKSLQTAVYNDVVCELEGMIERLAV